MLIICASNHHTRTSPAVEEDINKVTICSGIKYYQVRTRSYKGNNISRILNMAHFSLGVAKMAREIKMGRLERPDIIISSSAHIFSYLPARLLAKRFKTKLIFEVRDLWPLSLIELIGIPRLHPFVLFMSCIEKSAYKKSDAVVSVLPNAVEYMVNRGLNRRKFNYIPNGVNSDEWEAGEKVLNATFKVVFDFLKANGKFVVVYAGAHGLPNALDQVLDLGSVLQGQDAPYHFIFIGDGNRKKYLQERAEKEKSHFVSFFPRLQKKEILPVLLQADACFIGWERKNIYRFGISPNKIGDYFMAGKPVVHAVEASNNPVAEAGAGITVEPYNPVELDQAIRRLIAMGSEERNRLGERGKKYAVENLEWAILGKRYADLCLRLLNG
jgi:glycosyltransferase involved in cell wall biosynthesis